MRRQGRRLAALAVATAIGLYSSALVFFTGDPDSLQPPDDGRTLVGVQLDWATDTPLAYAERTGIRPAQYGDFVDYPLTAKTEAILVGRAKEAAQQRGNFFLTLMPQGGLETVTEDNAKSTALTLATLNKTGVHFYVRFAHEMNGSWYPWCQQPEAYIKAFRTVADAIHRYAPGNAMVWSPNYGGGGYPFPDNEFSVKPGTADFAALDTNHDKTLTMEDDTYAPYYPGDEYVDWVGITLYWWGFDYPWGDNEVPDDRFAASLQGEYAGKYHDESDLTDFYQVFAVGHDKPMAISETAALYNEQRADGADEHGIKQAWLDQVLAPSMGTEFPQLKMINWFEHRKPEIGTPGVVDWRITGTAAQRAMYSRALAQDRFEFAPDRWEIQLAP